MNAPRRKGTGRGARGLTRKQLSYIKARLLEKRRELLSKMDSGLRNRCVGGNLVGDDLIDQAQESENWESSFQIAEIESAAVEQINEAIERIDSGTYGICEMCHQAIPPARLKALPSAHMCVECQGALERDRAHGPSPFTPRFEDIRDASYDPERIYGTVRGRKVS